MSPRDAADPPPDPAAVPSRPDPGGRLARTGAELVAAAGARADLARRLEDAVEARKESVRQGAALDEMRRRLDLLRARADGLVVGKRRAAEGVERRKEQLQAQMIDRVLPLSRALAAAHRQVQEAKEGLSGEKARLGDLQRLLRTRQRCMVGQVAALYPVRVFREPLLVAENHRSDANGENGHGTTHLLGVIKSPQVRHLTFFGWQIGKHKPEQQSYTHKELQRSAAVLGYAAHVILPTTKYFCRSTYVPT
uniref:Uncharacterized protein n=1 Tax=Avena sativa TaxID=4498 RepID=A0ACD5TGK6_AVESA